MGQLQNGPRGPLAPVPTNEGLLNPLQPARTGFVPTRPGSNPGVMPQPTGFGGQQPMMMQPTGYAAGFQQGYGAQPQQIQPSECFNSARVSILIKDFTGFQGNFAQQSTASNFNTIASMRPPEPPQNPDKFAPSNIFAAMKQKNFGQPEEQNPQGSGMCYPSVFFIESPVSDSGKGTDSVEKYDALRPLTTGYNGAPQMGMMSQQTGMMPQATGMNMGMNGGMNGMGQMGGGQMGGGQMGMQQTGMGGGYPGMMMNQMTGFQPPQGYGGYQGYR